MFKLTNKYRDFIRDMGTDVDVLEGTTASGKTTIAAGVKFMAKVAASDKKIHAIAARSVGVAEKNILNSDNGLLALHPSAVYNGNGNKSDKIPHIVYGNKVIYILGYSSKDKWEIVLGSQFGCVFIDEANTANIEFLREVSSRNDYMCLTLNPDDPDMPIYKDFINCCRPLKKYKNDIPEEIKQELRREISKPNWRYWFFTFIDNAGLTEKDIAKKKSAIPIGTKIYKNKILGLRGKSTGLVFGNFKDDNIITEEELLKLIPRNAWKNKLSNEKFVRFTSGLDTSYSSLSEDTVAMTFHGITNKGRFISLEEDVSNNKDKKIPFAPSDIAVKYVEFLNTCYTKWGIFDHTYVDSADQATITELKKYKREIHCNYIFNNSYKKVKIIDRINMHTGWIDTYDYLVSEECPHLIKEYNCYSYLENGEPEDKNDHCINSTQYAWIPYRMIIGINKER